MAPVLRAAGCTVPGAGSLPGAATTGCGCCSGGWGDAVSPLPGFIPFPGALPALLPSPCPCLPREPGCSASPSPAARATAGGHDRVQVLRFGGSACTYGHSGACTRGGACASTRVCGRSVRGAGCACARSVQRLRSGWNGLDHSAQDGARRRRSRAVGEGGSAACVSVPLLGRQTDGQTVPLQNTPAAAPREVRMLGDILNRFPFARGAGDTEALPLSSQAGSGGGTP